MNKICKHVEKDGFHRCGSHAFNLYKDDIDQGELCDVHYWQTKAQPDDFFRMIADKNPKPFPQRTWQGLTNDEIKEYLLKPVERDLLSFTRFIEAKLKEKNT